MLINPYRFAAAGGGGGSGAHAYWRIRVTTNNGDGSNTAVGKVYMYADYGRINQAVGGTAIASDAGASGNVPGLSFDYTNLGSRWVATTTVPVYLGYHFSTAIALNGIMLRAIDTEFDQLPVDFTIDYSDDGAAWTTAWTVTGVTWANEAYESKWFWNPTYAPSYSGSPIAPARYWSVLTISHTADTFSCAELKLPTVPGGASVTSGGTAIADNSAFGAAANAFDGNNTTFWAPTSAVHYIGYDFGAGNEKAIAEMRWKSRSAGVPGQNPKRGEVRFSSDGAVWQPAWIMYDGVTWTDGMEKTFTDPFYV